MATGSLDCTTSRSNLQSVWHWVSDSLRCFKGRQETPKPSCAYVEQDQTHSATTSIPQEKIHLWRTHVPSYPHVRHRGRGVKELADDVGGGSNAEEDGADDLLPPGQQQHGILPPATPSSRFIPLDQANGSVALLSVDVAVGEVVAIVWKERERGREKKSCSGCSSSVRCPPLLRSPTIWILKNGQRSVAVFIMRELVIVETLVKFI